MINVVLCGSGGKMGGYVAEALREDKEMQIVAGVDKFNNSQSFPVFKSFSEITTPCDLIIDF